MRKLFGCLLAAAALSLSACAPATLQALRDRPAGQTTFQVSQNYQQVYRTVLTQSRRCFQSHFITAQVIVQGDLYSELRSGEVNVALHGAMGVDTYLGIDIKALDDTRTQVQTYFAFNSWAPRARAVEAWTKGSEECGES